MYPMNTINRHRVAFVGCGNIAGPYAASLARHPELQLVGVFDVDATKRAAFADLNECANYATLDALVADQPDIVVNLTGAKYHYATTRDLLTRGQVVFSEKPLAMTHQEAAELVELAERQGVRLACAPSLWLAEASLAAADAVLAGDVGTVRLVNAEVNQGRIEAWHPAPQAFYDVGPVIDAGVYPLTYLTAVFGPICRVTATSATLIEHHTSMSGKEFDLSTPDAWFVIASFESGPVLRLSCTFFVDSATQPRFVDFHGDSGSLRVDDWIMPGSALETAGYAEKFTPSRPRDATKEIDWSIGLVDLAAAIRDDRPHRNQAAHAAHVVEVLEAINRSAEIGQPVEVHSSFPAPLHAPASSTTN